LTLPGVSTKISLKVAFRERLLPRISLSLMRVENLTMTAEMKSGSANVFAQKSKMDRKGGHLSGPEYGLTDMARDKRPAESMRWWEIAWLIGAYGAPTIWNEPGKSGKL